MHVSRPMSNCKAWQSLVDGARGLNGDGVEGLDGQAEAWMEAFPNHVGPLDGRADM